MSYLSEYVGIPPAHRIQPFDHIGIMIIKQFTHGGLRTGPPITVGSVKLARIGYNPRVRAMVNCRERRYWISALCPHEVLEQLMRWVARGPYLVEVRYLSKFHPELDSFTGVIEELGYPADNNKHVHKYQEGIGYPTTITPDPTRQGKAYILFREQGSHEIQKIQ
jgi:hypothetical protein